MIWPSYFVCYFKHPDFPASLGSYFLAKNTSLAESATHALLYFLYCFFPPLTSYYCYILLVEDNNSIYRIYIYV